jgi:hypothetical protein
VSTGPLSRVYRTTKPCLQGKTYRNPTVAAINSGYCAKTAAPNDTEIGEKQYKDGENEKKIKKTE